MSEPHYVRDYRRFVNGLALKHDEDQTALIAVGGGTYEAHGDALRGVLIEAGLAAHNVLVDVGCGSGRLSAALSRSGPTVDYLGTDVAPQLLDYARRHAAGANFDFVEVDGLEIPLADGAADIVAFFSVLTHLTPAEQKVYLLEARRVLKPSGVIVASYIELHRWPLAAQIKFLISKVHQAVFRRYFISVTSSNRKMKRLAEQLGMSCTLLGPVIGQSVCLLRCR